MTSSTDADTYVPATIGFGLRAAASRSTNKIALTDESNRERSYKDLIQNIDRVANFVNHELGLKRGSHAALMRSISVSSRT